MREFHYIKENVRIGQSVGEEVDEWIKRTSAEKIVQFFNRQEELIQQFACNKFIACEKHEEFFEQLQQAREEISHLHASLEIMQVIREDDNDDGIIE